MSNDTRFGSWSPPGSPLGVEYSLVVIEEIRHAVSEGVKRLSRGGIEVGGILYGSREGRTIRVQAMRDIECEHARGPQFLLSDRDRTALGEQLAADLEDPRLEEMIAVGWFLSHTRSEISLSEADLDIYNTFFPAPWQVTLVVRPGRSSNMRAGFFVREPDGSINLENPYPEFGFPDRLAGVLDAPPRDRGAAAARRGGPRFEGAAAAAAAAPAESLPAPAPSVGTAMIPVRDPSWGVPQFAQPPKPKSSNGLLWVLGIIALLMVGVAGVLGYRYFNPAPAVEPLQLSVLEHEGQLQIAWNHMAHSIAAAPKGKVEIVDGTSSRTVPLTPTDLARGSLTYVRNGGDVRVRLTVDQPDGSAVAEESRFLGAPPAPKQDPNQTPEVQEQSDQLQQENRRLRTQNQQQADRIQQLERTMVILRARLGIDQDKK